MQTIRPRYTVPVVIVAIILALALISLPALIAASSTAQGTTTPTSSVSDSTQLATATAAVALALNPVEHNTDWTPYFQTFDGIEMALVPVGCFMMGSEDGEDDEKPVHQQCFDAPFWIDKTEVTNAQYGSSGAYSGDSLPRDSVTWIEAHDFCISRGARLPTEREWEYVARGPDNLIYPWGNDFVADNVVYSINSNIQPADVGSRTAGNSWIGAFDLSGNVWEWVSTSYGLWDSQQNKIASTFDYPYRADDGREENSNSIDILRVLRGGSWVDGNYHQRASARNGGSPSVKLAYIGFRCARSYE